MHLSSGLHGSAMPDKNCGPIYWIVATNAQYHRGIITRNARPRGQAEYRRNFRWGYEARAKTPQRRGTDRGAPRAYRNHRPTDHHYQRHRHHCYHHQRGSGRDRGKMANGSGNGAKWKGRRKRDIKYDNQYNGRTWIFIYFPLFIYLFTYLNRSLSIKLFDEDNIPRKKIILCFIII